MKQAISFLHFFLFSFFFIPNLQAQEDMEEDELVNSLIEVFRTSGTVSYEKEATMGETIALVAFTKFGRLTEDEQLLNYVAMVGNTVARASARPHTPYYFAVCENPDPNAFAVPGGYVFVTTGLLKLVKNEEELAGILGHEIAHITLQHAIRAIRASKRWGFGLKVTGVILNQWLNKDEGTGPTGESSNTAGYGALVATGFKEITETGHGYRYEVRSDEFGMDFAYRAGYHPQGLRHFLQTLADLEKEKKDFALFRTHRSHKKRVKALGKLIKKKGYAEIHINHNLAARFKANLQDRLK